MADYNIVIKAVDQATAVLNKVQTALAQTEKQQDSLNKKLMDWTRTGATAFAGLVASATTYAKSISDANQVTGISTATILAFGQGMGLAGGEARKAGDAVDKFSENLGGARAGSIETIYGFSKLGISFADLGRLSNEDLFKKTIEGLGNVSDKAQQAALKQQFFGKTLDGVNVSEFSGKLGQLSEVQKKNAENVEAAAKSVNQLKDAYSKLELATLTAIKPFADAVNKISPEQLDKIAGALVQIGALSAGIIAVAKSFEFIAAAGAIAFGAIRSLIAGLTPLITGLFGVTLGSGAISIIATLISAFMVLGEVLKLTFDIDIVSSFVDWLKKATNATLEFIGLRDKATSALPKASQADVRRIDNAIMPTTPVGTGGAAQAPIIAQLAKQILELTINYTALGGSLKAVNMPLTEASMKFEALNQAAERLGVVLEKPAKLIQRDYAIAVAKTTEELRRHEIELANDTVTTQKFNNELQAINLQIYEQSIRMMDASLMARKFNLETTQTNQQLRESAMRLANAGVQQDIFTLNVIKNRQEVQQQKITLGLLDEAFVSGTISLREYADELGKVDQRLLGSSQIGQQVISQGIDEAKSYQVRLSALNDVTQAYNEGKISIEAYTAAVEKLSLTYSATPLPIVLDRAKKLSQQFADNSVNADKLREAVANGSISWKEYEAAVQAIGQEHFPEYERQLRMLTPMSVEFTKTVQESATKMSNSFTDSFYQILKEGRFTFSAFKDMVTGILDDIAKLVIRKAFADPIANAIAGMITGMQGAGGGAGGINFGSILSAAGAGTALKYGTNIGSQQTSMLAAQEAGMGGGFLSGIGDWFKSILPFADGGVVTGPTMGLIGEAGPEAVIPLGQAGKYGVNQMVNGPQPVVNFSINAVDTQTGVEFLLKNKPVIVKVIQDAYDTRGRRGPINS